MVDPHVINIYIHFVSASLISLLSYL